MNARNKSYNPADTLKLVKHSRLFHIPRRKVYWGTYSQLEATISLLEAAASQEHYEHYHMLSGSDLPIKKQDELIDFFEHHHGVEFISIDNKSSREIWHRWYSYYYPFREFMGGRNLFLRILNKICITFQKILHVHRNKDIAFQKGADWYSISDEFVRYVLSKRDWIRKVFHHTIIPTEAVIHTLVINSHFRNSLFTGDHAKTSNAYMRLIDWVRAHNGHPHVFTISDLEMIQNSEAMFARKFMPSVDSEIIQKIKELYS